MNNEVNKNSALMKVYSDLLRWGSSHLRLSLVVYGVRRQQTAVITFKVQRDSSVLVVGGAIPRGSWTVENVDLGPEAFIDACKVFIPAEFLA